MHDHRWCRDLKRSAASVRVITNHPSATTASSRQKREGQIGWRNASVDAAHTFVVALAHWCKEHGDIVNLYFCTTNVLAHSYGGAVITEAG